MICVRSEIGPLPLDIGHHPELYMPFIYTMLCDHEAWNTNEEKDSVKAHSLLPQER